MSDYRNPLTDYSPQMETAESPSHTGFGTESASGVFDEDEEIELASQLLEIKSEQEFGQFVDGLMRKAERVLNRPVEPPLEEDIGDILKSIAKVALPIAGSVLGGFVGGPPGAALGGSLASAAGHAFGLELEGLSPEDSEFEVSKQFIRFAAAIVQNALAADPHADPARVARRAAVRAARAHAPGLMNLDQLIHATRRQSRRTHNGEGDTTVPSLDRMQTASYQATDRRNGTMLSEEDQMDLAADLMEMESEEEFENFLGDLISKGAEAAGKFISSPAGQALGGALKDAAKQLLPVAGQAVGSYFGGPTGGQIGGALGTAASSLFEAEADEQEWEAANIFVKVAVDAIDNAGDAPPDADPHAVAHHAVTEAVRRHAPHLMRPSHNGGRGWGETDHRRSRSGHWARHGRHIVVYGL